MIDASAFTYIRRMVKAHAGIVVEPGKEYLAESRLTGLAHERGFARLGRFIDRLRGQPFGDVHRRVVELLTVNETSFFRDLRPFDALRTTIIPELLKLRANRRLVIWSAAASSGQEPYSIAIVLCQHFPELVATTRIIASDLSREMLARTKQGVYSSFEVERGLSAPMLAKFMVPVGKDLQMRPELRAMIDVRQINLTDAFPPIGPVDILFARNVLIYFDQATKRDVLVKMRRILTPDGVLLLGGAETTLGLDVGLERVTSENKAVWYRARRGEAR